MSTPKIDSFFQELPTRPALHVIIEPHPDVQEHMRHQGWYSKPNVKILEGKWQDYVGSPELLGVGGFDVIYTDTFSEEYKGSGSYIESHQHGAECNDQNFTISSNFFQTLLMVQNRVSASSTAWGQLVGALNLVNPTLLTFGTRCTFPRRLHERCRVAPE